MSPLHLPRAAARCALWLAATGALAQTPVHDPKLFRSPLVFVPPQVPGVTLANHGSPLKYTIDLTIGVDGTVTDPVRIEPDHAEFRAHLNQVTKFWLFFPSLEPATCRPVPSHARIGVEFTNGGDDGTRTWLEYDPMMRVMSEKEPEVTSRPDKPRYPPQELRAGKHAQLYTVATVDAKGKVEQVWTLLDKIYSRGFVRTAERHAAAFVYDSSDRPTRCVVTQYIFVIQ